jgi:pimeloyl-ACP methyl ester carboxylesterase
MLKPYPPAPLNAELKPVAEGFVAITPKGFAEDFAQDLQPAEINALWAVQGSASLNIFTDKPTMAAWKTRPSWYLIGANDRAFPPAFHRGRAKAINATAIEIKSSHVPMLSQPQKVAEIIVEAATKAGSSKVGMR